MKHSIDLSNEAAAIGVLGRVESGFEEVIDAFAATIPTNGRHGAAMSVWVSGRPVIEAWGGIADDRIRKSWEERTLTPVHSCTKGMAAVAAALLLQNGDIRSFEDPLASVWPAFGVQGKDRVTIGDALAHRGGISAPRETLTRAALLDGSSLAASLANQTPLWEPGASHQYHALTHGVIVEQLVKHAKDSTLGRFFHDKVAQPLAADVWIGMPETELPRLARPGTVRDINSGEPQGSLLAPDEADYWLKRANDLGGELPLTAFADDLSTYTGVLAAANGVATASGLARVWSATVTQTLGTRLLTDETVAALTAPRSVGCPFLGGAAPYQSWGAGVMIPSDWQRYLTPQSFGHDGGGGQIAFADSDYKLGFAYVTNELGGWERGNSVVAALRKVLG